MKYGPKGSSWTEFHFYCKECGLHVSCQGIIPDKLLCSEHEEKQAQKDLVDRAADDYFRSKQTKDKWY